MVEKVRVCVTGGGGYQASWLVKLLLSKGYIVHATCRDPNHENNAHLKTLEKASENLLLFKADLLDYDGLSAAIKGCSGVFHIASPTPLQIDQIPNPEKEILEPALTGTDNVLKASSTAKIKRVVVLSSITAVILNSNWPKNQIVDESCWADKELREDTNQWGHNWYCLSKRLAESHALEYGKKTGLDVVTACPSIIIGPMLQSKPNATGLFIHTMMKGGIETMENRIRLFVDVRDVAESLLLLYEKPEAYGRITEFDENLDLTTEKLQKLGWRYRALEETLEDSVKSYQEKGILD